MALSWKHAGADVTIITGMPNRPQGRIYDGYRGKLVMKESWRGIRVLRSWLFASPKHGFARTIANNATFMATSALHALARARPLDVLIASSPPFFPHIAGAFVSRVSGTPLVLEIRDLWPDYLVEMGTVKSPRMQRALFALERSLLKQATRVVVVTESFRRRVAAKGVPIDRIDVISNGVDGSLYYPANEAEPLPDLKRASGEFIVGYLGNIGLGQGLVTVLEAAAIVERSGANIRFVVAGDGPDRAVVEARARELALKHVSIKPSIPKESTRPFYNACDLCLVPLAPFPILRETVPSKIFEVMACARPLIASLGGEGARIVEESGGGWVTPPGDAQALADGIIRASRLSTNERHDMGERGRDYVMVHYDRAVLARRYLGVLQLAARDGR